MNDKVVMIKLAGQFISTIGVSKVVHDVIRNNVTVLTPADGIKVAVGSLVIGSMVADHTIAHVNGYMDRAIAWHASRKTTLTVVEAD